MDPVTITSLITAGLNLVGKLFGNKKSNGNANPSQGDAFVTNLLGIGKDVAGVFGAAASRKESKNMWNEQNAHLTGREAEANAFNAEQAQIQRDYQTEMSNTSYQRAVTDMQAAGVNPALAMSNGGASTPTGSNASSVGVGYEGIGEMIAALTNAKVAEAQIGLMKSEEAENYSNIDVNEQRIGEIIANIEQKQREIAKTDIELKYFDDMQQAARDQAQWNVKNAEQDYKNKQKIWENYEADTRKKLKEIDEIDAKIALLTSQKALTDDQKKQLASLIAQSNAMTSNLVKEGKMTQQDIDNYQWNHAKELKLDKSMNLWVLGGHVGETVLVFSDGRIFSPRTGKFLARRGAPVVTEEGDNSKFGVDPDDFLVD